MRATRRLILLFTFAVVAGSLPGAAQTVPASTWTIRGSHDPAVAVPNLSGTWVMVDEKSDLGGMPSAGARTDVIDHQEPKLHIKRTVGDANLDLTYEIDGKPWKNMSPQGEVSSTLTWEGAVLVVNSSLSVQGQDVTLEDRYSLSDDGKTLTQARTIHVQGQEIIQKLVFTKQ